MSSKPGSPWIHEKNRVDLFSLDQHHFWLSLCTACADGRLSTWCSSCWWRSRWHWAHSVCRGPTISWITRESMADLLTWTKGQDGSSRTASELAARAPLRKVGPRFTVILANLHKRVQFLFHFSFNPTRSWIARMPCTADYHSWCWRCLLHHPQGGWEQHLAPRKEGWPWHSWSIKYFLLVVNLLWRQWQEEGMLSR